MHAEEWQFDGLVGPTHNYAGLAHGNLAAQNNAGAVSNPRAAALQGLEKMRFVQRLGLKQAFLPPHPRPLLSALRRAGFQGSIAQILQQAAQDAPALLNAVYSSSFMWTANAATIAPSADTADQRLHVTPSAMSSHYHRAIEAEFSHRLLRTIFADAAHFAVHPPLPLHSWFGDEGAANHMRVAAQHGAAGLQVFVYGQSPRRDAKPTRYPARQQLLASESVARLHQLSPQKTLFLQQSPEVIDQGVFHNDVIAMNTTRRMIVHEHAFVPEDQQLLREACAAYPDLRYREIRTQELSVQCAVSTYFFNSVLLDLGEDRLALVAPQESEAHTGTRELLAQLQQEGVLSEVHFRDLRESMRNGGGPACLRLRVAMTEPQAAAIHPGIILTEAKYQALKQWVSTHYRDRLTAADLRDPAFVVELNTAYQALEVVLGMPGLYTEDLE